MTIKINITNKNNSSITTNTHFDQRHEDNNMMMAIVNESFSYDCGITNDKY